MPKACVKVNNEIVHRPDFRTKSKKNRAPEWLMYDELEKRRDVSAGTKLVAKLLTSLIESSGGEHYAFESWIARTLGLSTRTVQRATAKLETIGFLAIEHRGGGFSKDENGNSRGRANRYSLAGMHDKVSSTARQDDVRPHDKMSYNLISTNTLEIPRLAESQSNRLDPESASPPISDSDGKKESKAEILSKTISREDSVRWSRMLADEREYGRWRFEREPKCYIPKDFIEDWERRNPLAESDILAEAKRILARQAAA